jgi:hypothetical protein
MRLFFVSLFMGFVPTRRKTEFTIRHYCHVSGDVVSSLIQMALASTYWLLGLIEIGAEISSSPISQAVAGESSPQIGGMAVYWLALWSHLFRPSAFLWMLTFFDGLLRIADACVNQVHRAFWFIDLGDFVLQKIKRRRQEKQLDDALGSKRPDELVLSDDAEKLDFFTSEETGFSPYQSACYRAELYALETCELVPRGESKMYQYRFRRIPHSEVARGKVIQFDAVDEASN